MMKDCKKLKDVTDKRNYYAVQFNDFFVGVPAHGSVG